ncbi:MAG: DUF4386 domain-containing protein [Hyphomicrobiales bacterium]
MTASRRTSLAAGIFFALTFVHVLIFFFYDSVLNDADYILAGGDDTALRFGALTELVVVVANVATAVVLFSVLRREHEGFALGYVAVRVFESSMIAVGTLSLLAALTLREDLGGAGGDAASLNSLGASLVAVRDWTFLFGPGFCAGFGNGFLLGFLMYRSGLVPRNMALIGLIGGPLSLVGCVFVLFGQWDQDAPVQLLFTAGEIAWGLSLTVYLILKGFRPSPVLEGGAVDGGGLLPAAA